MVTQDECDELQERLAGYERTRQNELTGALAEGREPDRRARRFLDKQPPVHKPLIPVRPSFMSMHETNAP